MADHWLQVRGDRSRERDHCQDSHEGSRGHIPSSSTKKRGMYILYYIIGTLEICLYSIWDRGRVHLGISDMMYVDSVHQQQAG